MFYQVGKILFQSLWFWFQIFGFSNFISSFQFSFCRWSKFWLIVACDYLAFLLVKSFWQKFFFLAVFVFGFVGFQNYLVCFGLWFLQIVFFIRQAVFWISLFWVGQSWLLIVWRFGKLLFLFCQQAFESILFRLIIAFGYLAFWQVLFSVIAKIKVVCESWACWRWCLFSGGRSCVHRAFQQSVHLTCGSLRGLQAFFWLRAFSCSQTESTPAHKQVTQTVGWLVMEIPNQYKNSFTKREGKNEN